jgi:quinol monooxygenase YgiN
MEHTQASGLKRRAFIKAAAAGIAVSGYAAAAAATAKPPPIPKRSEPTEEAMIEVSAIARIKIHEGKLEEFKRLAARCVHSVRTKDSGTLQYDYFFNAGYTECVVFERYRDFAAMQEHLANIGDDLMQALFKACSISGDIFAVPTPELRKAIEGFDIRLYTPYQPV